MPRFSYTQTDYDGERTNLSVEVPTIDAANFDAQVALADALETAIQGVSIGADYQRELTLVTTGILAFPSDSEAKRELKWLVRYHDNVNVNRKLHCEIGCADIIDETLLVVNTEKADLTHAAWVAFIAAFEGYVLAPVSGSNVTVESITQVARNT